jgi:hypothetical protein
LLAEVTTDTIAARGEIMDLPDFDVWWEREGKHHNPFDLRNAFCAGAVIALARAPKAEPDVEKALRRAFSLGQTYWQQADSESYTQNRLSDVTREKFEALVAVTLASLA